MDKVTVRVVSESVVVVGENVASDHDHHKLPSTVHLSIKLSLKRHVCHLSFPTLMAILRASSDGHTIAKIALSSSPTSELPHRPTTTATLTMEVTNDGAWGREKQRLASKSSTQ